MPRKKLSESMELARYVSRKEAVAMTREAGVPRTMSTIDWWAREGLLTRKKNASGKVFFPRKEVEARIQSILSPE